MADNRDTSNNDGQESAKQAPVRNELVDTAVRFLNNPKLQGASLSSRKEFLKKKGLLEAEVELAIAKAKEANPNLDLEMAQVSAPLSMTPPPIAQRMVERKRSWKDYAFITVIVAGVSYVIVMVVKKYILPWFWRREEQFEQRLQTFQATIQQMREETANTLGEATKALQEVASEHRRHLGELSLTEGRGGDATAHGLEEVKTELSAIKGLILGRHQFPQPPTPLGKARIPAWQQSVPFPQPAHPENEQPGTAKGQQLVLPVTETGTGKLVAEGKDGTDPLTAANGQGEGSDDAENTELNDQG